MKKIIIALFIALLPFSANAQLNVKGTSKTETIATARMGYVKVVSGEPGIVLMTNTTNQFDDWMAIRLGKDKDESIATLKDLVNLVGTIGKDETIEIDNVKRVVRIYRYAKNTISLHDDAHAGFATLTKSEIEKLINTMSQERTEQNENIR